MTQVPPHNVEAEQSVIGGLMLDKSQADAVMAMLSASDFYRRDHQIIFSAIEALAGTGDPFDAVTLGEHLYSQGAEVSEQVANGYLVNLARNTPSAANILSYAAIVADLSVKRQLADTFTSLNARALNCASPDEIITDGLSALTAALRRSSARHEEPMDLFTDYETQDLKPEWLPPGVAQYAIDQARVIGIAPEMVALSCLVAIAGAIHDGFTIQARDNDRAWRERACLWFMLIAEPGSKKSTAVKRGMAPLHRIDAELTERFAAERAKYIPQEKEFKIRQQDAARRAAKGEGYEEPPEAPERPRFEQAIFKNATNAALSDLLVDNPRGLTMYSDEIVTWFAALDPKRDQGEARGYALKAYDGGPEKFNRVGRGNVHVPNWSYSVIGTTQPDKINKLVANDPDDGLLQRFMVIDVRRGVKFPDYDRGTDPKLERQYEDAIRSLWNMMPGAEGSNVQLSPEAAQQFKEFSRFCIGSAGANGLPSMLRGHISKWEGLWPRLALIYHCWGCALTGKHPASVPVSTKTTDRVTAFMKRFLLPQSMRFYGHTVGNNDPVYALAQKVASAILARRDSRIFARDLHNSVSAWKTCSEQHRKGAIQMLKDAGWIVGADRTGFTGHESGWIINPRVHQMFADRALVEADRRVVAADTMRALKAAAAGE